MRPQVKHSGPDPAPGPGPGPGPDPAPGPDPVARNPSAPESAAPVRQNTRFVLSSQSPFSVSFHRRIFTGSVTLRSFET